VIEIAGGDENQQTDPISVLLVEDHAMVADALVSILELETDIRVVGHAETAARSLEMVASVHPDVVVMDQSLPDGLGSDAAREISRISPDTVILMITGGDPEMAVRAALAAGCAGFVSKDRAVGRLVEAIRLAHGGAAVFPVDLLTAVNRPLVEPVGLDVELTDRELEVLKLLAKGYSTDHLASELYLSVHTVRNHVRNLLGKLGAGTKLEAVVTAAALGLVEVGPGS